MVSLKHFINTTVGLARRSWLVDIITEKFMSAENRRSESVGPGLAQHC